MRSLSWRVVPAKQGNLTEGTLWREGAGGSKELLEGKMMRTLCLSNDISTRQEKIAQRSRQAPSMVWTTLAHHIDVEWLGEAYRRTRKDGAVGVDGVTAQEYEAALLANLEDLLERFRTGRYRAPPVRRVHIGKDGAPGKTRPIGIPTLEDKILQRAVLMVLEPMYEQDFLDCSHGFRPGRGAHRALEPLWKGLMDIGGGWVIDLDIQSFFDTVSRKHLRSFLDRRVRDGVIRRVIGKWLKAGVMEEGAVWYPEEGTPQGGVITPRTQKVTSVIWEALGFAGSWRATVRRTRKSDGDAMPDDKSVIANEDVLDDESHDSLSLGDLKSVSGAAQTAEERREGFG
jgi:retron-type reverse transcriptase